jgi:hypothetical protein
MKTYNVTFLDETHELNGPEKCLGNNPREAIEALLSAMGYDAPELTINYERTMREHTFLVVTNEDVTWCAAVSEVQS